MHTVDLYEIAKHLAESLGYEVREENLGGIGGGACEVAGRKCLFVDVTAGVVERLEQVTSALQADPAIHVANVPTELHDLLEISRAA